MAAALKVDKKLLRKTISLKLRSFSPAQIQEQSKALTARVLALPPFTRAQSVSCYLSMPTGEIDTFDLARNILRSGKKLFVPKIDPTVDGRMDLLRIYDEQDLDGLPSGLWGIKEPTLRHADVVRENAQQVGVDVILVPCVAFDRSFSRLGHGKGYYDRFITTYSEQRPKPLLVGLALREQLLDADTVPTGKHDWNMDYILTDQEVLPTNGFNKDSEIDTAG
ncbi:hypothetical protein FB45DRAFT_989450 [Roridomyces roridus]|uniref:5-formyltetrahydrofolate cyclo-ligase n=1 Tax=Roridomyces roridus TaxID=1738132 RepID=A0AAD7BYX4_9AGAR|nr:hypothetical protein FB45DRAFT_989450 [Roridomyces roridus]